MDFPSGSVSYSAYSYSEFRYSETKISVTTGGADESNTPDDEVTLVGQSNSNLKQTYAKLSSSSLPGLSADSGSETASRGAAADTILSFVEAGVRSAAEAGASAEEIAEKITSGVKGFVDGFDDAYGQLSEMGFLYAEVEEAIEQTYSEVMDGIQALADEFDVALPLVDNLRSYQDERRADFVPATRPSELAEPAEAADENAASVSIPSPALSNPVSTISSSIRALSDESAVSEAQNLQNLIQASSFDYRAAEARSFNFVLQTQDGDKVTIRAAYASSDALEGVSTGYGEGSELAGSFRSADGFFLDVKGDIDEEEFAAISDLLAQVKEVSDSFFEGDIEAAFNYALEIGFDTSEIAKFSLRLQSVTTTSAEERYQSVAPVGQEVSKFNEFSQRVKTGDERLLAISRFIENIESLRVSAERSNLIQTPQSLGDDENRGFAFVRSVIEELNLLAASASDSQISETEEPVLAS
jgi:hypothetical protein